MHGHDWHSRHSQFLSKTNKLVFIKEKQKKKRTKALAMHWHGRRCCRGLHHH